MNSHLAKSIFISALGHLTLFSIFTVSLGGRIAKADYTCVSFLGQLLRNSQVVYSENKIETLFNRHLSSGYYLNTIRQIPRSKANTALSGGLKPIVYSVFNTEKMIFKPKLNLVAPKKREEPSILFHPLLPYGFKLYFKDRQVAHVELLFNIVSDGRGNSTVIKRKISSGNLEADLLIMRYISHYLFIEKVRFSPDKWQTVKIDLSAEEK